MTKAATYKTLMVNVHTGQRRTVKYTVAYGMEVQEFREKVEIENPGWAVKQVTEGTATVKF